MARKEQYQYIAEIFKYPSSEAYIKKVNECHTMMQRDYPESAESWTAF